MLNVTIVISRTPYPDQFTIIPYHFIFMSTGIGYHLVTVKEPNCDVDKVIRKVTSFVPEAKLENNVGAELSFTLPRHSCGLFHGLFSYLENNRLDLGISSFGASITTLEEVFLK